MAFWDDPMTDAEWAELDAWLALNGYTDLHEWAADSDYILTDEGLWTDSDHHPVDIASCAYAAMEAEAEYEADCGA